MIINNSKKKKKFKINIILMKTITTTKQQHNNNMDKKFQRKSLKVLIVSCDFSLVSIDRLRAHNVIANFYLSLSIYKGYFFY